MNDTAEFCGKCKQYLDGQCTLRLPPFLTMQPVGTDMVKMLNITVRSDDSCMFFTALELDAD